VKRKLIVKMHSTEIEFGDLMSYGIWLKRLEGSGRRMEEILGWSAQWYHCIRDEEPRK